MKIQRVTKCPSLIWSKVLSFGLIALLLPLLGNGSVWAIEKTSSANDTIQLNVRQLSKPKLSLPKAVNQIPKQTFTANTPTLNTKPASEPTLDMEQGIKPSKISSPQEGEQDFKAAIPLEPGDTINLQDSIIGVLVKNGSILSDGSISLPLIGRVALAGMTVPQARQTLTEQYKHYFSDPQLSLRIARRHPVRVYITGAVTNPGVYISGKDTRPEALKNQTPLGEFNQQFRFYRLYLADALIMAGGLNYNANVRDIVIHRRYPQQSVMHVNLLALFEKGSSIEEIALQDQDVIEVPTASDNTLVIDSNVKEFNRNNLNSAEFKVSVIGAVNKPGGYPVQRDDNILTAISKAGGLTLTANASRVFILHATAQGQLTHRIINMQDKKLIGKHPMSDWAALLPNDVIFVDESSARKMAFYGRDLFLDRIAVAAMFPYFNKFFNK